MVIERKEDEEISKLHNIFIHYLFRVLDHNNSDPSMYTLYVEI